MTDISKKEKILHSAIDIFREKGKKTTITDIGKKAEVTDSIIYHYFKNKEDLLFYAAGEQLRILIETLKKNLANHSDPLERFKAFLYFQLHYHDKNPNYTNLTIFECRSKERFFRHDAFIYFREWTVFMRSILEDCVEKGVFRKDMLITVARDAVLGLLDMESIHCLAAGEIDEAHKDMDHIMALIIPMFSNEEKSARDRIDKAARILSAAEKTFAEKGYDNSTTLDISRRADVAEGTLYEYFKNKEDLLFTSLEKRLSDQSEFFQEICRDRTPLTRLKQIIQHQFFTYISQPEFMKIFIFDGIFNKRFYRSSAMKSYVSYISAMTSALEQGKKDGSIRNDVDNRVFKNLFMGIMSHMTLRWYFKRDDPRLNLFSEINEAVNLLIRAVSSQP